MMLFKAAGATLLSIALVQGWMLALYSTPAGVALRRLLPGQSFLLRSHIDYLMMTLFLFAFAALGATPPIWMAWLAVAGAAYNPLLFLVLARRPDWHQHPSRGYQIAATLGFVATTVGFGGTAWSMVVLP